VVKGNGSAFDPEVFLGHKEVFENYIGPKAEKKEEFKCCDEESFEEDDLEAQNYFEDNLKRLYTDLKLLEPHNTQSFKGKSLDLCFLMDCTGSMGSWIDICKEEINNIVDYVVTEFTGINIRIAFVGYRDYGDKPDFSVKDFTTDPDSMKKYLTTISASGGNDMPEDVFGGLDKAINLNWKSDVKICFFIADAPCHGT
jgi:hypothetical protein